MYSHSRFWWKLESGTLATRHPFAKFPHHVPRHAGEWWKVLEVWPLPLPPLFPISTILFMATVLLSFILIYRVVHSWHFWLILHSFFHHFLFHFVSIFQNWNWQWKKKCNPNLAFAKMDLKNEHFSSFWQCAWSEKCILLHFSKIPFPGCSW